MRARVAVSLIALAGCGGNSVPAAPDREIVETLAAVHLAQARAELAGADIDSARVATLDAHGVTPADYDGWLTDAARDPAAGTVLWEAVGATLDSTRTAGGR